MNINSDPRIPGANGGKKVIPRAFRRFRSTTTYVYRFRSGFFRSDTRVSIPSRLFYRVLINVTCPSVSVSMRREASSALQQPRRHDEHRAKKARGVDAGSPPCRATCARDYDGESSSWPVGFFPPRSTESSVAQREAKPIGVRSRGTQDTRCTSKRVPFGVLGFCGSFVTKQPLRRRSLERFLRPVSSTVSPLLLFINRPELSHQGSEKHGQRISHNITVPRGNACAEYALHRVH